MKTFNVAGLKQILSRAKSAVVLCHHNADPDAVASAIALGHLLKAKKRRLNVALVAPEGISAVSKKILDRIQKSSAFEGKLREADCYFLVDTSTIQQLGPAKDALAKSGKPIIVIDHHAPHPHTLKLASLALIKDDSRSTCEIILRLYDLLRAKPTRAIAFALLAGIVYETRHFAIATAETIQAVSKLIRLGADPQEAIQLLKTPMPSSERIARLKAARRIDLRKVGPWLVAVSTVGSYQASAARALIALGADIAVVGGERGKEIRISLRASEPFLEKTKLHLGRDVAKLVGAEAGGMGGGHALAAGINARGDLNEALKLCEQIIAKAAEGKPPETILKAAVIGHAELT